MITVDPPIVIPLIIAAATRPTVRLRIDGAQYDDCCERADALHDVMLNARWMQLIHPDFSGTAEMVLGSAVSEPDKPGSPNCGNIAKPGKRGTASSGVGMFSPNSRGNDGGFCAWAIWMPFVR
jgi:hypothetical protein